MPNASSTFGDLLKQLRKRAGMTQGDLAAALGYSISLICALEQNRRLPDMAAVIQTYLPALALQEAAIRRYPDVWVWMHRRWKTRPPPAGSLAKPMPKSREVSGT